MNSTIITLAALGENASMGDFEKYLGGFLGLILAIGFVGMIGGIVYEIFIGSRHGGINMEGITKYIVGMVVVIVLSVVWKSTIGEDFMVDPQSASEAFSTGG